MASSDGEVQLALKQEEFGDEFDTMSEHSREDEFERHRPMGEEAILRDELEKKYSDAVLTIDQLRMRLVRRTKVIEEIRKCYLRDVVALKNIMEEVLTGAEKESVIKEFAKRLPSLDLRQALPLYAPSNTEMRVIPCDHCGGRMEAVLVDSDEVGYLKKQISQMRERESRYKLNLAELDARVELTTRERAESSLKQNEEVSESTPFGNFF